MHQGTHILSAGSSAAGRALYSGDARISVELARSAVERYLFSVWLRDGRIGFRFLLLFLPLIGDQESSENHRQDPRGRGLS